MTGGTKAAETFLQEVCTGIWVSPGAPARSGYLSFTCDSIAGDLAGSSPFYHREAEELEVASEVQGKQKDLVPQNFITCCYSL